MDKTNNVSRQQLKDALIRLGVSAGMVLEVHSSLSSFGHLEGGAMTLIDTLKEIVEAFREAGLEEMLNIDFSVVGDLKYYNGIIFKGFAAGVPDGVISGGQYDKLMKSMKRTSKAIGFGVYIDSLGKLSKFDGEEVEIK